MTDLSETAMRVLSELEEAGEEDVPTLLNTIFTPDGVKHEAEEIENAITRLAELDLVRLSIDREAGKRLRELSREESMSAVMGLASKYTFDPAQRLWRHVDRGGPPYGDEFPYVVATESGRELAFKILDERGYQWWRQDLDRNTGMWGQPITIPNDKED